MKDPNKTCATCRWWYDYVCTNGDSICVTEFVMPEYTCDKWEGKPEEDGT